MIVSGNASGLPMGDFFVMGDYNMGDVKDRFCCYIDGAGKSCSSKPIWEVWVMGDDPYTFWDTCIEHVADILTDAPIHAIHRIDA